MKNTFFALSMLFAFLGQVKAEKLYKADRLPEGIYAKFETTKGDIIISLEYVKTPMTVANFVGLAEGKFTALGKTITTPFYDGLKFHRVIANFMIQGGDPLGTGAGGPGYSFYDEFDPTLKHSGAGILSMANSGPATNGSQFFITHNATPHLDGKHTVFGHVIEGQDVVNKIAQDDIIKKVTILRIGKKAKAYDATATFAKAYNAVKIVEDEKKAEFARIAAMSKEEYKPYLLAKVQQKYPKAQQTASGLVYLILDEGTGDKPVSGNQLSVNYRGTFLDGTEFDASRNAPMDFVYLVNRMVPGFEEGLAMMAKGGKGIFVIPYFDAYGAQGRPGAIPPYSDLVFELQMVDVK